MLSAVAGVGMPACSLLQMLTNPIVLQRAAYADGVLPNLGCSY